MKDVLNRGYKGPSVNTIFVYPAELSVRVEFPVPWATRVEGVGGVSLIGHTRQNLETYSCAFQQPKKREELLYRTNQNNIFPLTPEWMPHC